MEHEIVTNERELMGFRFAGLEPTGNAFRIRQCRNCGCSERAIKHFGWDECTPPESENSES